MATERKGTAVWEGSLLEGSGRVSLATTGLLQDVPVTWAARTEAPGGTTSPEELIAAAHAGCFAMQLSHNLALAGTTASRLDVSATASFGPVENGFAITGIALDVVGDVPGADEASFAKAAEDARTGCPVSKALEAVPISLSARLGS